MPTRAKPLLTRHLPKRISQKLGRADGHVLAQPNVFRTLKATLLSLAALDLLDAYS